METPRQAQEKIEEKKKPEEIGNRIIELHGHKNNLKKILNEAFEKRKEELNRIGIKSSSELAQAIGGKFKEHFNEDEVNDMEETVFFNYPERPNATKDAKTIIKERLNANANEKYEIGKVGLERERIFLEEIEAGNYPSFVRPESMVKVEIRTNNGGMLRIPVTRTRLAIGTDSDYIFLPCNGENANRYLNAMGYKPLTKGIFDAIEKQSTHKLHMRGLVHRNEDSNFMTGNGFVYQTASDARRQLGNKPPEGLVSGEGKVILPSQREGRLRIYGGRERGSGRIIQPDSHPHNLKHEDYSQGTYGIGQYIEYENPQGAIEIISYQEAVNKFPELQ